MTYAITGASGQLGRLTAERLLATVDPAELVLLTRSTSKLDDFAARGVTVRAIDFDDPSTFPTALAGVDRLLLISTDVLDGRLEQQQAVIDGAAAAGVKHVVYTSIPRPTADNPAWVVPSHAGTEEHLAASGLGWTSLRNNLYSDMQLDGLRHAAESGRLVTNAGDGGVAYVTRADCAAVAAGALLSTTTSGALDVTGPQSYTPKDLAEIAAGIGGRPVEVVAVDDAAFAAGLVAAGLPQFVAEMLAAFGASARGGFLSDVTDVVRELGGVEPTPLTALV